MKCTIPEISWHNRDPVLAADIQPKSSDGIYRLATGGTDTHVVIWQLGLLDNGAVSVEMLADLTRHNRAVNAVRFSTDGHILASSDDETAIILWKRNEEISHDIFMDESEKENKEHWNVLKMLRGHIEDVYDLSWSPCSQFLVSGSVDNTAILWDVTKGKSTAILSDHKGFVQGVSWDPQGVYVASISSDRCLRLFNIATKKVAFKSYKADISINNQEIGAPQKDTRLFYDDTLKSFCRRLSFSPDGELIMVPSGIIEHETEGIINAIHVFSRYSASKPVMYLPTGVKSTLAVRFCPKLFKLRPIPVDVTSDTGQASYVTLFNLPYRMIFAVATQNAVLIYDTQQPVPVAKISNIHYTRLSDLSWSSDGRILAASSTDGYCSLVSFNEGELGEFYEEKPGSNVAADISSMEVTTAS